MNNNDSHRQPAAVSADAVDARRVAENISFAIRHKVSENSVKQIFEAPLTRTHDQIMGEIVLTHLSVLLTDIAPPIIQAYGDACRLDGARNEFERLREVLNAARLVIDQIAFTFPLNKRWQNIAADTAVAINAALSPETVCGGE